jgi:integrase
VLTDQAIKAAIARAKAERRTIAVRDTGKTRGLECRVSYGGTASFALLYKVDDDERRLALGTYGSRYSLADARKDAAAAHADRGRGIDPVAAREATKAEQRKQTEERRKAEAVDRRRVTVKELCDLFLKAEPRHRSYMQIVSLNIAPKLGKTKAADVTRADVQRIVDAVASRGAGVQARRVFEVLRAAMRWGAARDYLTGEPWKAVSLPDKGEPRTRVLTAAEIRWLWAHTADTKNTSHVLRLQLLLGQRSGEVAGMAKSELSVDRIFWTIPGERTKNKKPHTVPLPPLVREMIAKLVEKAGKREHFFVGTRGKVARSDGVAHDLAEMISTYNEKAGLKGLAQVEAFTAHDLRRTMATGLETIGIPMSVISAALNHISVKAANVTQRHYAHADLTMEVRAALTRWQAVVEQCVSGEDPFEVRMDDIEELEARLLARGAGVTRLRVVR